MSTDKKIINSDCCNVDLSGVSGLLKFEDSTCCIWKVTIFSLIFSSILITQSLKVKLSRVLTNVSRFGCGNAL